MLQVISRSYPQLIDKLSVSGILRCHRCSEIIILDIDHYGPTPLILQCVFCDTIYGFQHAGISDRKEVSVREAIKYNDI